MSLIVLEGLDGAGKSTQVKLLSEYYRQQGEDVFFMHFPQLNSPFFGEMISAFLRGDYGDVNQVHPQLVASLYAGDQWTAAKEIEYHLSQHQIVILDRYVYSNLAYQCAKLNTDKEKEYLRKWILSFEFDFYKIPKPDFNLFLDVPLTFVEKKLQEQRTGADREYLKGKSDIHENSISFQEQVLNEYLYLCRHYQLTHIDCSDNKNIAPAEVVFKRIVDTLKG